MNGEESLSLLRTLCTESLEGKQDLAFIGVILGNREIDSIKYLFCLCVSVGSYCTLRSPCTMSTVYICLNYWEGPDLGIGASASYYLQACGLQNYEAGSMAWEKDVSALPLSPENAGKSRAKPRNLHIIEGEGQGQARNLPRSLFPGSSPPT